jgi:hypothetical protein
VEHPCCLVKGVGGLAGFFIMNKYVHSSHCQP